MEVVAALGHGAVVARAPVRPLRVEEQAVQETPAQLLAQLRLRGLDQRPRRRSQGRRGPLAVVLHSRPSPCLFAWTATGAALLTARARCQAAAGARRPRRARLLPLRRRAAAEAAEAAPAGEGGPARLECRWCGEAFASRTQLFRHLRGSPSCVAAAERENPVAAQSLRGSGEQQFAAFRVGYLSHGESAEAAVHEVLAAVGASSVELARSGSDEDRRGMRDLGFGESVLTQEASCGASGDVVSASFLAPVIGSALMAKLAEGIRQHNSVASGSSPATCILDVRLLHRTARLSAELSCTKRTYRYLIPLRVVDPSWDPARGGAHIEEAIEAVSAGQPSPKLREALGAFKQTVRSAMSHVVDADDASGEGTTKSEARVQRFAGRRLYGSQERRQCRWHNFAPKELSGSLSPHRDVVRGALDRISHAENLVIHGELFLALALFGDHFLTQQCRRLVGSLLCIHHGWLPADFLGTATRPDVVVDTPLAPGHLLYLCRCQFGTWSRRHGRLFDASWRDRVQRGGSKGGPDMPFYADHGGDPLAATSAWCEVLHSRMTAADRAGATGDEGAQERRGREEEGELPLDAWLREAEANIAPKIRSQLEMVSTVDAFAEGRWRAPTAPPAYSEGHPEAYGRVLRMLRELVAEGRWPTTSAARGRLLRAGDGGSFSLGRWRPGIRQPRMPEAFPELASAIFELERAIAPPGREPSTWVAINRNALFSPHTDSGTGVGQSKSLIVGLGSYVGGELVVEGAKNDIRYQPLEFDGWRQRHWTLPFEGERFSLVWFSPA